MSLLVALQGGAPPDESSDGWWAGVQRCFVAVPIAGALAGLALSASLAYGYQQQTEDLVPQPQVAISEDHAQLAAPAPPGPRFLYLPDPDDIPAGVLFGTPDEVYGWSSPTVRNAAPCAQPWTVDDDLPVAPADDDAGWFPPTVLRAPVISNLTWDDQAIPAAPAVADDDSGWSPPLLPRAPVIQSLAWDDQGVPAPSLVGPPDDDYWQVHTPGPVPPRFVYLPDPELLPAGVLFGVPDDDAGWAQPWLVRVAPSSQPWVVPDEFPIAVVFSLDEGEGWTPTPARSAAQPPQPWTIADELPITPALDADAWSAPFVIRVAPLTFVWAVADDVPPIPLRVDEDYWWRAYSLPPVLVVSLFVERAAPPLLPTGPLLVLLSDEASRISGLSLEALWSPGMTDETIVAPGLTDEAASSPGPDAEAASAPEVTG